MYHFIRRFFIFVLVLAFGFSFLLCCFVHSGRCQLATDSVNVLQSVSRFPPIDFRQPDIYSQLYTPFGNFDEGFYAAPLPIWMNSPTWGALRLSDLSYLLPIAIGQSLFSGSTSSIMDRTGLQLGTTMQYSPSNFGSQSYTTRAYDAVGYGFPFSSPATGDFSLSSSADSSYLTSMAGYYNPSIPPFTQTLPPTLHQMLEHDYAMMPTDADVAFMQRLNTAAFDPPPTGTWR